jgi:hypothetical protein
MRRTLSLTTVVVSLVATLTLGVAPAYGASPDAADARRPATPDSCSDLTIKAPTGARLESLEAERDPGGTVQFPVQPGYEVPPPPVTDVPAFCKVVVVLTHGRAGDHERIEVWLPEAEWSGRFQALGGSGYAAGNFGPDLAGAVKAGYAVGTTDAGATPVTGWTSPWALTDSGRVNLPVLENFAERGPHELALVGKAVVKAYYGSPASYAYWNGCSTGGRQGYMEAQRHPDDFDGILAGAPAVSWDRFAVATLWPHVVMSQEKDQLSKCELDAFTAAAVEECDPLDGVTDGIIDDPISCGFDPRSLVGSTVECDGQTYAISEKDATVVRKIWDGPTTPYGRQLWYGPTKGADLNSLAGTTPFPVAASWVQDFLARDRDLDVSTISYSRYAWYFAQSVLQYHAIIATDQTDLSAFRRSGGKLLSWQGLADQLVPVEGTIRYREQVEARSRGSVDDYYRLFLAPGAGHCASAAGPAPSDPLAALVSWVEQGEAPATLPAATTRPDGTVVERTLCPYPTVSRYTGQGDPAVATSYACTAPPRDRYTVTDLG